MTFQEAEKLNDAIYVLMKNSAYSYKEARIICAHELGIKL